MRKQILIAAAIAALVTLSGCGAKQALTPNDIADIEDGASLAATIACSEASDRLLNDTERHLMAVALAAAETTIRDKGTANIAQALAGVRKLKPAYAQLIERSVRIAMRRVPVGADDHVLTRVVAAVIDGCSLGVVDPIG